MLEICASMRFDWESQTGEGRQGYTFIITFVKTVFVNCNFYLLIIFSHRVRMEVFTEQFNTWNEMKLEVSVVSKKT